MITPEEELEEIERISGVANVRSTEGTEGGDADRREDEQAAGPAGKTGIADSPSINIEDMTVEELDEQIAKYKKFLELAELHKQVKKHE